MFWVLACKSVITLSKLYPLSSLALTLATSLAMVAAMVAIMNDGF
jgi:hypothetical protein